MKRPNLSGAVSSSRTTSSTVRRIGVREVGLEGRSGTGGGGVEA